VYKYAICSRTMRYRARAQSYMLLGNCLSARMSIGYRDFVCGGSLWARALVARHRLYGLHVSGGGTAAMTATMIVCLISAWHPQGHWLLPAKREGCGENGQIVSQPSSSAEAQFGRSIPSSASLYGCLWFQFSKACRCLYRV
jgi:hypothetical protein